MTLRSTLAILTTASVITACGGGAGDALNESGENTLGTSRVEPLVGVWQLSSGWSVNDPDDALLVIRTPGADRTAEVVLYDFTDETDTDSQCYRDPFSSGDLEDALTGEVFITFSEFTNGIVSSVDENTIIIEFEDSNDVDGDSNTAERVSTTLTRVAQAESDIGPLCSGG